MIKQAIIELSSQENKIQEKKKETINVGKFFVKIPYVLNGKKVNYYSACAEVLIDQLTNVNSDDEKIINYYKTIITKSLNESLKKKVLEKEYTIIHMDTKPIIHNSVRLLVNADYKNYMLKDVLQFKPDLLLLQPTGGIINIKLHNNEFSIPYKLPPALYHPKLASTWTYNTTDVKNTYNPISNVPIKDMLNEEYVILDNIKNVILWISPGYDSFIIAKIKQIVNKKNHEPLSVFLEKSWYIDNFVVVFEKKYLKN